MSDCSINTEKYQEFLEKNFGINWENTEKGVRVEIQAKDPKQVKGFQGTVQYLAKLCTSCCQR